jgi:hypothetical protein
MKQFAERNPGTYYHVTRNGDGEFESLVFVPSHSFNIVKFAARLYAMVDGFWTQFA